MKYSVSRADRSDRPRKAGQILFFFLNLEYFTIGVPYLTKKISPLKTLSVFIFALALSV